MPVTCTPRALAAAATCFCLPEKKQIEIQTYLLQQMAIVLLGSAIPTTQAGLLAAAKDFQKFTEKENLTVQTYLLCQIAQVSGV